jgi:hypothetical protein
MLSSSLATSQKEGEKLSTRVNIKHGATIRFRTYPSGREDFVKSITIFFQ